MRTRFALICAAVAPLAAFAFTPAAGAVSTASPDPGGDPNASVPLPPPPGQYMGFNDDAAHSVHGLTEPASFECAIDRRRFRTCESPYRTPRLSRGRHRLQVRALDQAGQLDPTPAKRRFKVRRRRP